MKTIDHNIKIQPQYFDAVLSGDKPFEIRYNDREYKQGHIVVLHEYDSKHSHYTGRRVKATIGTVSNYAQRKDWVVFGLLDIRGMQ